MTNKLNSALDIYKEELKNMLRQPLKTNAKQWFLMAAGQAYFSLDLFQKSIPFWTECLNNVESQQKAFIYYMRGKCYCELKNIKMAQKDFHAATINEGFNSIKIEKKYETYLVHPRP